MERQLWLELYKVIAAFGNTHDFARKRFSDAWVALAYLWAAVHDRPVSWACDAGNWPMEERWRGLPSQPTMSRRLKTVGVCTLLEQAQAALRERFACGPSKWLDARPLPVGGASKDPDARCGRAARGQARGYKLHAVVDARAGVFDAWRVAPMSCNEKPIAAEVVPAAVAASRAPLLYVAADNEYDGDPTFRMVGASAPHGPQLLVSPRRKRPAGPGHREQSGARLRGQAMSCAYDRPLNPLGRPEPAPTLGESLLKARGGIERRFGLMGNFAGGLGPLPNWVRRPRRVALWVQAKLLVFMARECLKGRAKNKKLRR
jgi:hypothetical protein